FASGAAPRPTTEHRHPGELAMSTSPYRLPSLTAACLLALMTSPPAFAQVVHEFDLPQQPLADSLREIGRQATFNILFEPETVERMTAPAVQGRLSPQEAVERALAGSGLQV